MKLICVDYPFAIANNETKLYYPSLTAAKKDAIDHYICQEEHEDSEDRTATAYVASRIAANVYEVNLPLKKSVISDILNGESNLPCTEETLTNQFRYRRGKIVVSKAKVATETPE